MRGQFWNRRLINRGSLLERQPINKGALLERLNNTGTFLLTVLLLLVNHSMPSHIVYALCLFLSCLSEDLLFDTVKMLHLITGMFLNLFIFE